MANGEQMGSSDIIPQQQMGDNSLELCLDDVQSKIQKQLQQQQQEVRVVSELHLGDLDKRFGQYM